ncbi:MAG: lamin tail domain-containing protein [Pirellulales bacterium]|nr:lamin tail domain-containing protein [Pirellulales bacterium]
MASNDTTFLDGDGNSSDWIEIHNPTSESMDLGGWHLTDDSANLNQWIFPRLPQSVLDPGEYLIVFASGQAVEDYVDPSGYLHTDFRLDADGEYLALTDSSGVIIHEWAPEYPQQIPDISYGMAIEDMSEVFVASGAATSVLVPTDSSLGLDWTSPSFVPDASWITTIAPGVLATTGVGFDSSTPVPNLVAHWPLNESSGTTGMGSVMDITASGRDGSPTGSVTFGVDGAHDYTGTAANFENGSINVPYHSDLNPESFTVTAWVCPDSAIGYQSIVTSRFDGFPDNYGYILYINSSGNWSYWTGAGVGASGWETLDGSAVVPGEWQHLAISYAAETNTKTLWIDGEPVATTAYQGYEPNPGRDLHMGGGGDFGDQYRFSGTIDDVALFDAALDQVAIQSIMAASIPDSSTTSFADLVNTDITASMEGINASAYIRIPFDVTDPSQFNSLQLRTQYDDGFIAYLNGQEIVSRNAPTTRDWNSEATAAHPDSLGVVFEDFNVSSHGSLLDPGTNILAIHGLNVAADDSDFLVLPELVGSAQSMITGEIGHFLTPTPGGQNPDSVDNIGPSIGAVEHRPNIPTVTDPIIVTAEVTERELAIDHVTLHYRVMYGTESNLAMMDDGLGDDQFAGDGIYTATVPAGVAGPGQMFRYYVTADDIAGKIMRAPLITDLEGNNQSPEYYGTVILDPAVSSLLPILHWFAENPSAGHTRTGTRASVFYEGAFYDNLFVRMRGQATNANSQKFDFNTGHEFYVNEELGYVREFNLNAQGADPAYIRQTLAFEAFQYAGNASPESFLMLTQVNGSFDRVGIFIEQVDDNFLERNGLDPNGALYKFVQRNNLLPVFSDVATGVEKKIPENDTDFSDLQAFIDGLHLPSVDQRHRFLFDSLNIPQVVNYLAVRSMIQDADDIRKNFYFYRDSHGNGEWSIFPWDKDFTLGVVGDGGPYLEHPLFGEEEHPKLNANQWNILLDVLFEDDVTRQMYLRRLRTLMDELLQHPSTPTNELFLEQRAVELFAPADPHLGESVTSAYNSMMVFFPERRNDLFNIYGPDGSTPLIPESQAGNPEIQFGVIQFNPSGGDQDQEYIELVNNHGVAIDISGWRIEGGVTMTFQPGTVIPSHSSLYVSPNVVAFRSRTTDPSGGLGLFVLGNYSGHLSNFGETLRLIACDGEVIHEKSYEGDPSPVQLHLRITELNYNPAGALTQFGDLDTDNDQFEFIELVNTSPTETLDLAGVRFSDGIDFTFGAGTLLAPNDRILVVANQAAFESRYGSSLSIAGVFENGTNLSNGGETVKLEDATGSTILEFTYHDENGWPDRADGAGSSLVVVDTDGDYSAASNWRASTAYGGTPGGAAIDRVDVIIHEVLAHTDLPAVDAVELFNRSDSVVALDHWWLSDTSNSLLKYQFQSGTSLDPGGYLVVDETDFNASGGANPTDFALSAGGDTVWLVAADSQGRPIRFADVVSFDATLGGVSLGRVPSGSAAFDLFPLVAPSLGMPNGAHLPGALIVSELHYHSPAPPDGSTMPAESLEFVELYNRSGSPVVLNDSLLGPWRIRGGIDFDFSALPSGTALEAGGIVVIVPFDPSDPRLQSEFRSIHGIGSGVVLYGPYEKKLDHAGEVVRLLAPTAPPLGEVDSVYYLVDRVTYEDSAPWPTEPDGTGPSLHRIQYGSFGDRAASWMAACPSPGSVDDVPISGDFDRNGVVDHADRTMWEAGFGITSGASLADGDADGDGDVDGGDFLIWQKEYGSGSVSGSGSNSPISSNRNRISQASNLPTRLGIPISPQRSKYVLSLGSQTAQIQIKLLGRCEHVIPGQFVSPVSGDPPHNSGHVRADRCLDCFVAIVAIGDGCVKLI